MPKVIHLIPYDGIGGVESAARSMADHNRYRDEIDFQVVCIFRTVAADSQRLSTFNPFPLLCAVQRVLSDKPDLLIVSLWRSCIVGFLAKLFCRRLKLVLLLHLPSDVHALDWLFTRLAAQLAHQVWADSGATLARRLPCLPPEKGRVISFVTQHVSALEERPVGPNFIFWGRINPQKGLDRALSIFSAVRDTYPQARFTIIGPDGGDIDRIRGLVKKWDLSASVSFPGGMEFDDIVRLAGGASFYLQTSLQEGMAMSVVEAMQLGLLPVVTPVGEIGHYCRHGENALFVRSDDVVAAEIINILNDNSRYLSLRKRVLETWVDNPLYKESVLNACKTIFASADVNSKD